MSNHELARLYIGDRDWAIQANLGFTRYLDDRYATPETKGIAVGINSLVNNLKFYSPDALVEFIKAGTSTEPQKPQTRDIEEFLNNQEELEPLFEMALEGIKKSPMTRLQTADALETYEKMKAIQEKQMNGE